MRKTIFLIVAVVFIAGTWLLGEFNIWRHNRAACPDLFTQISGTGQPPVILLHGLAGAISSWDLLIPSLSKQHQTVAMDLLGYGQSRWPTEEFGLTEHLKAMQSSLDNNHIAPPYVLVGHSFGTHLAVRFAIAHPEEVQALILLSPPLFRSKTEAIEGVGRMSSVWATLAFNPVLAPVLNQIEIAYAPLVRLIVPLIVPDLRPEIAHETILHTWHTYQVALEKVMLLPPWTLEKERLRKFPILILMGKEDHELNEDLLKEVVAETGATLRYVEGDHNFILKNPKEAQVLINDFLKSKTL